ncbi:hypothetical protein [Microbacterium pumilum]|uniref:Polysaccharide chain length determinant N-terminal domain-containing protein n=1 Tax=Microbacterium pumilum TaxID=344165 RepID=A0ABN2S1J4_9MICO
MVLDVLKALARRWYVLVAGVLLTAGIAYGAYVASPPEYNARGLVLLLPSEAAVGVGGNPFLTLSGLEQPAGIVVAYFGSTTAQAEVAEQSPTAEYVVGIDDSTRGPVIAIDVTDHSAAAALSTLNFIAERIPAELERLQQDVDAPAQAVITSMPLTIDEKAKSDISGTLRLVIAALAAGVVATGFVAFALDGVLLRRSQSRRSERTEPAKWRGPAEVPGEPKNATAGRPVRARARS